MSNDSEAGAVNKIVRKHYPIERLPPDLRAGLQEHGWVNIEIEPESEASTGKPLSQLIASGPNVHGDPEDVLAHIRSLREDR